MFCSSTVSTNLNAILIWIGQDILQRRSLWTVGATISELNRTHSLDFTGLIHSIRALDLLFKFQTPWCKLAVIPPLFLRNMVLVLSVPKGQTPPKTNHYSLMHNALLALGLAFLDDPVVRDYKAGRHFAEEAKHHMETEWSKASTCSVNALATIATFHLSQGTQLLGSMYFGEHSP